MENLEFKIHQLPKSKPSDVIEIKFKKDVVNASLIRSLENQFRKAGHEGLILILPPDDDVKIDVKTANEAIDRIMERVNDQNN